MPEGIIVMKWNERTATDILFKYPSGKNLKISDKTLLHILNLHGFKKKPGIASLTTGQINFITYYSGREKGYYVILLLNMLENPEDYEKHFERIAQKIIDTLGEKNYKETIHSLYNQLT